MGISENPPGNCRRPLERSTTDKSRAQEILGAVKENTVDVVEGVNDAFENAIRLSSYIAARENGVSRAKAAQFAKNITVNFNKHGEYGQVANQIFLFFFNASVQGTARLGRSLVTLKPPKAPDGSSREWYQRINTAQKMAAGLTVFSAMLAQVGRALSDEDEDGTLYWDKIPDYVKERNMIIMVDGKNYIKVPLPYGYNMFANLGTGMVDLRLVRRHGMRRMVPWRTHSLARSLQLVLGSPMTFLRMAPRLAYPQHLNPFLKLSSMRPIMEAQCTQSSYHSVRLSHTHICHLSRLSQCRISSNG